MSLSLFRCFLYILISSLTSVGFEDSVCHESLLTRLFLVVDDLPNIFDKTAVMCIIIYEPKFIQIRDASRFLDTSYG